MYMCQDISSLSRGAVAHKESMDRGNLKRGTGIRNLIGIGEGVFCT